MRRTVRPELLDSNSATDAEIRSSLKDLQFINRWFGGVSTTRSLLQRVLRQHPSRHLSVLDVGSATGDGLANVQRSMNGTRLSCTLLDRSPSHFDGTARTMKAVLGDALSLPFQDDSFDVVLCSLFVHHLEPEQIQQFAHEALRVARLAFLINDLRRSYTHLALVYAGQPLFRSRVTRHDTVASVRRAYTPSELRDILDTVPARSIEFNNSYLYRQGIIAWK